MGERGRKPLTEELLAQAGWLQALARKLVGDGPNADDIVQETWLSALQGPGPRDGSERPWLAQVLRNVLRKNVRRDSSRRTRENRLAVPDDVGDTSDAVARAEGQEALAAAVLKLKEPLRTTVLRRYFDGLSSAAIAKELGLPPSTVRNRLKHALEQLRTQLDPKDRPGLVALAGWPLRDLTKAASPLPSTNLTAATILMTTATKTALAIGLTTLLLGGVWLLKESSPNGPQSQGVTIEVSPSDELPDLAHLDLRAPGDTRAPAGPTLPAVEALIEPAPAAPSQEPPLPPGQLEVLVLLDGEPVSSGTAHVFDGGFNAFPADLAVDRKGMHHAPIDTDGRARFQGIRKGFQNVAVEVEPGYCQYTQPTLSPDEGMRLVIDLHSNGIEGRVFDATGSPVEGATVLVDGPAEGLQCTTWTDMFGRYSLRGMAPGEIEVTKTNSGGAWFGAGGEKRLVNVEPGSTTTLDFGTEDAWPRWTGAVRNAAGELMPVAKLPYRGSLILKDKSRQLVRMVLIADDGTIDIAMEPGTYEVAVKVGLEKVNPVVDAAFVMPNRNLQHDLTLPGAVVRGQILEKGKDFDPMNMSSSISLYDLTVPGGPTYSVNVDRNGHFVLNGVAPGTYKVLTYPRLILKGKQLEVFSGDAEVLLNVDLIPVEDL